MSEASPTAYLDNNATTPLAPEVREAMLPYLGEHFGNPSGGYAMAREARAAVETARESLAALIGARTDEIVFTSCGTESIHTSIASATASFPDRRHLVTTAAEHSATYEQCKRLEQRDGFEVSWVGVDAQGHVDMDEWSAAIREGETVLASMIWANNETGVIAPVVRAAEVARDKGVLFHSDAVQAAGKLPIGLGSESPLAMLSLSGHKLHAPKGVGALWVNRHVRFSPLLVGGGQENDRRSGTENVLGIVGFGKAAELARAALADDVLDQLAEMRDAFEAQVMLQWPQAEINGDVDRRLANTSNLYFPGIDAEGLLILLDRAGVCCSPGSACSTGAVEPSRVIKAMGYSASRARSSVRFSFSRFNTAAEIEAGAAAVVEAARKLDTGLGAPTGGGGPVIFNS